MALAGLHEDDPREIGPYALLGRLGAGGMGVVYLAQEQGGEQVAVKLIHTRMAADPAFRRRFTREVAAARRVARFCTAAVLDADVTGELAYLITEYVEGPSLGEAVRDAGPLRGSALDGLAASIAMALRAIHGAGVVHRDLKPGNVLLSRVGPKVIDFGVAHLTDGELTSTLVGTPAYMSPEQVAGGAITSASDIFSWGCVIAYAASGASPFSGGSVPNVLYRIAHSAPTLPELPEPLRELVEAALSKDPAARPTADDLLDRLSATAAKPLAAAVAVAAELPGDSTAEPDGARTVGKHGRQRRWIGVGAAAVAAAVAAVLLIHPQASAPRKPLTPDPVLADGVKLYAPPLDVALEQADRWATSRPDDAALMRKLAQVPFALWLSGANLDGVAAKMADAKAAGGVPVFVADYVTNGDCTKRGAKDTAAYLTWIKELTKRLGDGPAVIIMEPNSLQRVPGTTSCPGLPGTQAERLEAIGSAVRELKARPRTAVYLDGGQDGWPEVTVMADRLIGAGLAQADGFHLNTSGYQKTDRLIAYGRRLGSCVTHRLAGTPCTGKAPQDATLPHFVIDTARNGRGEWDPGDTYADPQEWCNPPSRGLGERPGTTTADALVDAYLWITEAGVSYGPCERDGKPDPEHPTPAPPDGEWWNELALERAKLANPPL